MFLVKRKYYNSFNGQLNKRGIIRDELTSEAHDFTFQNKFKKKSAVSNPADFSCYHSWFKYGKYNKPVYTIERA